MIETNPEIRRMERGVVYVATGEGCRQEAIRSAKTVKRHNPSIDIAIFTEMPEVDPVFDLTFLIEKPEFSAIDKVKNLWRTPFHKSIYIDADTIITGDLLPLFDLLDRVDFAGVHETARGFWYKEFQSEIPEAFGELNTGMMVFKATPTVIGLLKDWHGAYLETSKWLSRFGTDKWMLTNEQPAMRHLLYHRPEVKLWVLPTEYNALRHYGTYLWGKAIVVHGRVNIEAVAERMNRNPDLERGFFQGMGVIADFNRIPFRQVLETVLRVNACALLNVRDRMKNMVKRWFQKGQGKS
jgi:hypothetical protein